MKLLTKHYGLTIVTGIVVLLLMIGILGHDNILGYIRTITGNHSGTAVEYDYDHYLDKTVFTTIANRAKPTVEIRKRLKSNLKYADADFKNLFVATDCDGNTLNSYSKKILLIRDKDGNDITSSVFDGTYYSFPTGEYNVKIHVQDADNVEATYDINIAVQ